MNNKYRMTAIIAVLLMIPASIVTAQEGTSWFGDSADGQWLVGVKLGTVKDADTNFDTADNTTLVMGYQFAREVGTQGTASLELEIGNTDDAPINNGIPNSSWEARTVGLFLNYRGPGTVYFKAKLGVLSSEIKTRAGVQLPNRSDTNFAYGAGLGVILGELQNVNLELDWTSTSGDSDLDLLSLGGLVRF